MPLVQTRGAASAQGFGEFAQASGPVNYIEDVFSCFLYTGNGSTQTITNGIDLSGKGGLVWIKTRTSYGGSHMLMDTVRGQNKYISANLTNAQDTTDPGYGLTTFNTNGFSLGPTWIHYTNSSGSDNVSWTFRKQPKFFDVVTWTGNATNRTIAHSLGSVPGSIIVKRTDTTADWAVYHRSLANTQYLVLNTTAAAATGATWWNSTTPTSAVFSVGTDATVNASGGTYVAYLFAHNAGGFGLTGTDNVISCGSFNNSSGSVNVTLGYEPQWLLMKKAEATSDWFLVDNMRGMPVGSSDAYLTANTSDAENSSNIVEPTATGFTTVGLPGSTNFIYIAIRRGPMKVPTSGTSVYNALAWTGNATNPRSLTGVGFTPDNTFFQVPSLATNWNWYDRLRGATKRLLSNNTAAESTRPTGITSFDMDGITFGSDYNNNTYASQTWFFKRAPSFFDEVCYTGTGSTTTITHNLSVTPELVITKSRSQALGWVVWTTSLTSTDYWIRLDDTMAQANSPVGYGGTFSASNYTIANTGPYNALNNSGSTYVAYLFATCAGVSKVGSYTGTGTTKQIDCGFTGGARFVLIKRVDDVGDWYVWDSARGIVAGNDPYLLLNSTAAEVTSTDYVDTYNAGFEISSTAPAAINSNGGSFIFLAIA